MEKSGISLLEKFSTTTVIMPYYGPAHSSFLVLSKLNRKSREMLDQFYEEILNWMMKYAICLTIDDRREELLLLPINLFKFLIFLNWDSTIKAFLKTVENIRDGIGYYFNRHFMHDRLCIVRLNINSDFIEDLHPSIELLKATKVINCYGIDEDIQHFEMVDLISKFEIELRQIYDTTNKMLCFPHFVDKSGDKTKINPLFNSFKNISDVNLWSLNNEEVIKTLCDIRDLGLRIDRIFLAWNGSENSEKFTNPEFFKNGLNSLDYKFKEIHNLSDVFISNINSLKLSSLSFRLDFKVNDDFDYLKILTHAKNYSYLEFSKWKSSESIDLTFENLPMVIASCLQNSFFIKWRSFMCTIELDKIDKNYWFSKEKPKDCDDAEHTYIHLISSIKYEFKEPLNLSNTNIIKEISDEFSPFLLNWKHKWELIIPMRWLKSVNVKGKQILNFIDNQDLSPLLQEICKATKFNCSFDYLTDLKYINECMSLFPSYCSYFIIKFHSKHKEIDEILIDNYQEMISKLEMMHISSIYFYRSMSSKEYQFVKDLISTSNSKIYLNKVMLKLTNLLEIKELLDLLSDCHNIESIFLRWVSPSKIPDLKSSIKEIKNKFYKKAGIIRSLNIFC